MKKPGPRTVRIIVISAVVVAVGLLVVAKRGGDLKVASAVDDSTAVASTPSPPEHRCLLLRRALLLAVPILTPADKAAGCSLRGPPPHGRLRPGLLPLFGYSVILDFGASWCAPARPWPRYFKESTRALRRAIIRYVDVDKYRALTEGYPACCPTKSSLMQRGGPSNRMHPSPSRSTSTAERTTVSMSCPRTRAGSTRGKCSLSLKRWGCSRWKTRSTASSKTSRF